MSKKTSNTDAVQPAVSVHPFKRVRRAGVPLSFFETADPSAFISGACQTLNGSFEQVPILQYDIASGPRPACNSRAGEAYLNAHPELAEAASMGAASFLSALAKLPPVNQIDDNATVGAVVFIHNAHRILEDFTAVQAAWNCRDAFKGAGVSMAMLGCHSKVPAELKNDVPLFNETPPNEAEIRKIVSGICEDQGLDLASLDMPRIVDGLIGYLSAFNVEQSFCLSLKSKAEGGGVDFDQMWALKVAGLAAMGLEISLPKAGFETVGGNEGAKRLLRLQINGKERPRAILWVDEIEKSNAGSAAGNLDSGASAGILEAFLFWCSKYNIKGLLFCGIPGAGKSLLAQVAAAECGCPLIRLSFSGVKGGIVGATESNMRQALSSVDAIAQGKVLLISTCNQLQTLQPELIGRHTLGKVFFDYPTQEEANSIWQYWIKKCGLDSKPIVRPNWVGREIQECCEKAAMWQVPLEEAADTVAPICTVNAAQMDTLRRSVSGKFLSAAHPGFYNVETAQAPASGRKLNL